MWKLTACLGLLLLAYSSKARQIQPVQQPNGEISEDLMEKFLRGPHPLIELGNHTYYFEHTLTASWTEAKQFCRNLNLFLLSVEDEAEDELINQHLQANGNGDYWSSGNDLAQKGRWVWDSTGREVSFSNWHPGQPNHAWGFDGTDHIILYQNKGGTIGWNDYPESRNFHFVCKQL